jgi:hypothetical protein
MARQQILKKAMFFEYAIRRESEDITGFMTPPVSTTGYSTIMADWWVMADPNWAMTAVRARRRRIEQKKKFSEPVHCTWLA